MSAIAQTTAGQIEGTEENGLCVFRGIPFAAPPIGDLRFKAPRPVEPWNGGREARTFGPISLQAPNEMLDALLPPADPPQPQSKDCLYLNVWTPGLDDASRPVMVWIHGGAFTIGSGSEEYYNGANLASRGDVVIVTINYRLGALGFLNLPALGETNFGMRDQVAALKWVQANIANFGGDPNNVTIFGESAGGMSVASLMASPEAAGLFQKAIPQSGAGHNALTAEETNATAYKFCEALGVDPNDVDACGRRGIFTARRCRPDRQCRISEEMAMSVHQPLRRCLPGLIDGTFLSQLQSTTSAMARLMGSQRWSARSMKR